MLSRLISPLEWEFFKINPETEVAFIEATRNNEAQEVEHCSILAAVMQIFRAQKNGVQRSLSHYMKPHIVSTRLLLGYCYLMAPMFIGGMFP
jgi:hypothetical protein